MEVRWKRDPEYLDSWNLVDSEGETIAYTMRGSFDGVLMWAYPGTDWLPSNTAPSQDVEEAKVIIQAMVLLEG